MTDNYEDIIHLPHPTPKLHPRMPMKSRAAQFAPFAALKTQQRSEEADTTPSGGTPHIPGEFNEEVL